jgi:hypothetical protein
MFPFGFPDHPDQKDTYFKTQSPFNFHILTTENESALRQSHTPQTLKAVF